MIVTGLGLACLGAAAYLSSVIIRQGFKIRVSSLASAAQASLYFWSLPASVMWCALVCFGLEPLTGFVPSFVFLGVGTMHTFREMAARHRDA